MRRVRALWRNLARRSRVEADLDAELRATLDLLAGEAEAAGLSPEAARRSARMGLGSVEAIKSGVRDARAGVLLDIFWHDLRYGARLLRRSPLFTLTAIVSLAIGVGSTTAIFTIANGVLLRSATGVAHPASLVDIVKQRRDRTSGIVEISHPDYLEIGRRATTVADVFGYKLTLDPVGFAPTATAGAERVFANVVTPNYFSALGVRSVNGRPLAAAAIASAHGSAGIVISHAFWTRRFEGDRAIVGQTVRLNGEPVAIAGVADAAFRGTSLAAPDVWIPSSIAPSILPSANVSLTNRRTPWLMLGARLREGFTRVQASMEMAVLGQALDHALEREGPSTGPASSSTIREPGFAWRVDAASPIPSGLRGRAGMFLALLMAIVATVLVIACANVAGVLLARAAARGQEIAVRAAIGASRVRVVAQLLTETTLLVLLGGAAGLFAARVFTWGLVALLPASPVPIHVSAPIDLRVVAFSVALSFAAAILAGLAPALQASSTDVVAVLKDEAPRGQRVRGRHAFVAAQVAASTLLVVIAIALVGGLREVSVDGRGFEPRGVQTASLDLTMARYGDEAGRQFARELAGRARLLPGVRSASVANRLPGGGVEFIGGVSVAGVDPPDGQPFFTPHAAVIEPGYFDTLRIPLLAGRDFQTTDRAGAPQVVIVGDAMARKFWPGRSAVGERILLHDIDLGAAAQRPPTPLQVVGVAGDVTAGGGRSGTLAMYVPLQQRGALQVTLLVRAEPGRALAGDLRAVVQELDRQLVVGSVSPLDAQLAGPVEMQLRVGSTVAGGVGLLGLLLAGIGVYGVTAYAVARRTREIGIRVSLGAPPRNVVGLVLRQGLSLVSAGTLIGLGLGVLFVRLLGSGSLRVPPPGVHLLALASATVLTVGMVACFVPAWRATRIRAMDALRRE